MFGTRQTNAAEKKTHFCPLHLPRRTIRCVFERGTRLTHELSQIPVVRRRVELLVPQVMLAVEVIVEKVDLERGHLVSPDELLHPSGREGVPAGLLDVLEPVLLLAGVLSPNQ